MVEGVEDMENKMISIFQIALNVAIAPLCFIRFFREVGVFDGVDAMGNYVTNVRHFYYSIYEKLSWNGEEAYVYLGLLVASAAVVFAVLSLIFKSNRRLGRISYAIGACSLLTFAALLAYAATITRAY